MVAGGGIALFLKSPWYRIYYNSGRYTILPESSAVLLLILATCTSYNCSPSVPFR